MPQSYPVSAIAQLLKLTERRVQQLVRDDVLPHPVKGEYDAIQCIHGYIDYLKKLAIGNGNLTLTDERTRLTKCQANLAEIELKKAKGDLIDTSKAMQLWGEVVSSVRQRLLGLPTRLASIVAQQKSTPEIKDTIENAIMELLDEFANPDLQRVARMESDPERAEGLQATAKTDGKRVGRQKKTAKLGK